ncbi:MAG: hypothetical protein WBD99_12095 [Thermodesulfobacteriota bacterium]
MNYFNSITKFRTRFIKLTFIIAPLLFVTMLLSATYAQIGLAKSKDQESPKRVLQVKDYKWGSGGMGRPGIISEITLENIGNNDYENIEIEANFYTQNDIPLGSLRSTINDVLQSGTTKTFKNIKFGIMHSELQKTVVNVVGAEMLEKGIPGQPKDVIVVKDWQWSGGQYGTEGILKDITLENTSKNNYSNVKIEVQYLGVPGPETGTKGYTSRAVIHDILPAKNTRTYNGINVGFRHPDAKEVVITVIDADKISVKEAKYRLAKKGESIEIEGDETEKPAKKKSLSERYREERGLTEPSEEISEEKTTLSQVPDSTEVDDDQRLSLAERYRKEVLNNPVIEDAPQISLVERYKQRILSESSEEFISPTYSGATRAPLGTEYSFQSSSGISSRDNQEKSSGSKKTSEVEATKASKDGKTAEAENQEEEDFIPVPERDIVVRDFKLAGGGVPQTMGRLSTLTLENISGISYSSIQIEVAFFLYQGNTPMGSHKFTLYETLPPHSTREFKNVKIGMLSEIPQEIQVTVLDATAVE